MTQPLPADLPTGVRVLHVLAPVPGGPIKARCGHDCDGGPTTKALLADETSEHVIFCIDCFNPEDL